MRQPALRAASARRTHKSARCPAAGNRGSGPVVSSDGEISMTVFDAIARRNHPFFDPAPREPTEGAFSREEVRLANRNSGTLLETLRHDLTPTGLHYLLIHFD